ncbi:MAG: glutaminase family protein [Thermoguttaceae bacterium]
MRSVALWMLLFCLPASPLLADDAQLLRPPAVPLVTHDPYFSIWSGADHPAQDWPRHWTEKIHALCSMIRVDGKAYRLLGLESQNAEVAKLVGCRVWPTRSVYTLEAGPVAVVMTFTSPLLPDDLELVGRPVTYIAWSVASRDGSTHDVDLYFDHSAELVVNEPKQNVEWSRVEAKGLDLMRIGSADQPVLQRDGDDLRIDWGYSYLAVPRQQASQTLIAAAPVARESFVTTGRIEGSDDTNKPRPAAESWPVSAAAFDCGRVAAAPVEKWLMLAYDDLFSIQYFEHQLRPWWRRSGAEPAQMLAAAAAERAAVLDRCRRFDEDLMADATRIGGPKYADLCALAYRQALAAHKLVAAPDGAPLLFSKENNSNGCIATVDVAYPAAPIFALLSNDLLKAMVEPVFRYAAMDRWPFDFAPHDLGRYPKAIGQRYGGGEKTEENQMPVEESGNMILIAAMISQVDGNTAYAQRFWPQLSRWAAYLKSKGLDPENQLCTDDFAGHLAHNANLSLKAIVALGAYAKMCSMAGREDEAALYRRTAEEFAAQWPKLADDGDHYRLAFDAPGTWSQKYNLVWDTLLDLDLFPPDVARREIAYYKTRLNEFGLPLDNRQLYTKTDWEVWTATLAENREDFDTLMEPVYAFVNKTPQRVALTDWYWTNTSERRGFKARSVIGGVYIKMLSDRPTWEKWSKK